MKDKMIWSVLIHLEMSMWDNNTPVFDDKVWDEILNECVQSGVNQIVLDLGRGVKYGSHPELAKDWSWSRNRVRKEVKRLRELGIELIPKLNFSATHDMWLLDYERMLSTPVYYRVCRDLISEVAELFDHPRYIHLGMDEEDAKHAVFSQLAVYRHGDLLWHDLQFLCDCVRDAGSKPWIWADHCLNAPAEFKKRMDWEDIVFSPWMYNSIKPEHRTPVSSRPAYVRYYAREPYASMNIQYVEDDPFIVNFINKIPEFIGENYTMVPCVSSVNQCIYNAEDMLDYFRANASSDSLIGFMTAPWLATTEENKQRIINDIRWYKQAIDKVYNGIETPEEEKVNIAYDTLAVEVVY